MILFFNYIFILYMYIHNIKIQLKNKIMHTGEILFILSRCCYAVCAILVAGAMLFGKPPMQHEPAEDHLVVLVY
jgi:hypothetical protein